jgi:hypothetical protein
MGAVPLARSRVRNVVIRGGTPPGSGKRCGRELKLLFAPCGCPVRATEGRRLKWRKIIATSWNGLVEVCQEDHITCAKLLSADYAWPWGFR